MPRVENNSETTPRPWPPAPVANDKMHPVQEESVRKTLTPWIALDCFLGVVAFAGLYQLQYWYIGSMEGLLVVSRSHYLIFLPTATVAVTRGIVAFEGRFIMRRYRWLGMTTLIVATVLAAVEIANIILALFAYPW